MAAVIDKPVTQTKDFSAIAEAHLSDVYGYLLYMTRDSDLAEELTASSFERALRRFSSFNPRRGDAHGWLLSIARSTALDHFRSERRRRAREASVAMPEATEERWLEGVSAELVSALGLLTASDRELVFLRVVLELDNKQTARILNLSPTNCATRLSRALDRLQKELKND